MKKIFKTLLLTLMFAMLPILVLNSTKATGYATSEGEEDTYKQTVFMVDAKYIASTSNGTYVFDNSDNCLKLLNSDFSKSQSYYISGQILDLCTLEECIYMLTSDGILIFDSNTANITFMPVELSGQTRISASKLSTNCIICLFPTDTLNSDQQIPVLYATIDLSSKGDNITPPETNEEDSNLDTHDDTSTQTYPSVESLNFYTIEFAGNQISQTTGISFISFAEYNNQVYVMRAYDKSLTAYPVEIGNNITTSGNIPLLSPESTGLDTAIIGMAVNNELSNLIISYHAQTFIYNFYTTNTSNASSLTLTNSNIISHSFLGDVSAISMSSCGDSISILGDNTYLELSISSGSVVSKTSNPECNVVYRDCADFTYYKLLKSNNLIMSPDSKESTLIGGSEDCYVVEIADVYLSDNTKLLGYKYVMYTYTEDQKEVIKFGYIYATEDGITAIEQQNKAVTVKVNNNTKLYKYPSIATDNANTVILAISKNLPVKVLSYITDYKTPYGTTYCSYALVQVDGKIGFIDRKEILPDDKRIVQIIPNAQIIGGTNVYEYADTSSKILHKLEDCTKVRIIESRNAQGFIKISYNGPEGNYFEGYVKASYVKSNSYSTLQIIGVVLVILNVIFLIVLIVTKRKVVR